MSDYMGMEYLRRKLNQKRHRVNLRYKYYDMKNYTRDFGISTPLELRAFNSSLGWCAKTVDSLADRVVFNEFRNDILAMNEIYQMNNPDILFRSAELSAMIAGCAFIYIQPAEKKNKALLVPVIYRPGAKRPFGHSRISRVNTGGHSVGKILEYYKIDVNVEDVVDAARKGKRHAGTYNDAIKKTEGQLKRSIESHSGEVSEHAEKIKHPELYG